jgi:hypothetical protein
MRVENLPVEGAAAGVTRSKTTKGWFNFIKIMPKETFGTLAIFIKKEWPDQATKVDLPYCSAKPEEICKSWSIIGYSYLNPRI